MPMTERQMVGALAECGRGSLLFVSYKAGRTPTGRALLESERAVHEEGMAHRHYVGTFESLWVTRRGDVVLTIMAYNRDRVVDGQLIEGGYRTLNPKLGELYSLEVIEARPKDSAATARRGQGCDQIVQNNREVTVVRVLVKVTYEKCAGNAPTTHVTIPLGRVPSWLRRFRRGKHVYCVRWELLDEPQPKDFDKLTRAFRALGEW